jgi:hypothetical protein
VEAKAVVAGWALYVALMLVYSLFYLICKIREPGRRALAEDSGGTAVPRADHRLAQSMPPARRGSAVPEAHSAPVARPANTMPEQTAMPLGLLGSGPEAPLGFRLPE